MISVATIQLHHCSLKADMNSNIWVCCIPIKLFTKTSSGLYLSSWPNSSCISLIGAVKHAFYTNSLCSLVEISFTHNVSLLDSGLI